MNVNAVPGTATGNVLTLDTDVDTNDTHTVSAITGGTDTDSGTTITKVGTYGTLVITKATGAYVYTLDNTKAGIQILRTACSDREACS